MTPGRWIRLLLGLGLYCAAFVAACAVGGLGYFHFANPRDTCASCHEMTGVYSEWTASAHRTVSCRACHGGSLTLDVHALKSHVDRIVRHFTGDPSRPARLLERHVIPLHESCRQCHPQAFADWQVSRHSTTYARIFLDPTHNSLSSPTNDCLRCHGMFLQEDISSLVARPSDPAGSWTLVDPERAVQPAIPCLTCHQIHAPAGDTRDAGLYDHRERAHFSAHLLPLAKIYQGSRAVKVSTDPRQRICMECHAPSSPHQLATSDDRTPAGVHEGLSCLDCHGAHAHSATTSCSTCHPADSHCGIEVQKMDTTYLSPESRHNVHTVACLDCHPQGIPAKGHLKN